MKNIRIGLALCAAFFAAALATAKDPTRQDAVKEINGATKALDHFIADPNMTGFREQAKQAKGLLICGTIMKAGFIIGGSGGRCVFVAKSDSGYTGPAFYTMGTGGIGFQAGFEKSEIILLAMTQKAVDSLMTSSFKVGGGASVAAGPVGTGAAANASDFLSYSRSKGLYGGVDVNGSVINVTEDYNKVYYGKPVTPIDIIVKGEVHSKAPLMAKVEALYGKK
jgi:lipid-binding SYLF domain-containing protein